MITLKKNIIFIMSDLKSNGASKSIISLLNQLDYDKYEVDLFLFQKTGVFMTLLPARVNLLETPKTLTLMQLPIIEAIKALLLNGKFKLVFLRVWISLRNKINKSHTGPFEYEKNWNIYSKIIKIHSKKYKAAISFLEGLPTCFVAENVEAEKKISFIHTDYKAAGFNSNFDRGFFEKMNYIVSVSEKCVSSLSMVFPEMKDKFSVIHNIISPRLIKEMAMQSSGFADNFNGTRLLTVGRLEYPKGYDIAINALLLMKKDNLNVRWYCIGEGPDREKLERLLMDNNLEKDFVFLGTTTNPYPYILECDIYIQPSRWEGKSIALDEAKVLHKPIVVTNFPSVKDQFKDEFNGVIVPITAEGIFNGVKKLLNDVSLCTFITDNLENEYIGNENEVEKLYELIEEDL